MHKAEHKLMYMPAVERGLRLLQYTLSTCLIAMPPMDNVDPHRYCSREPHRILDLTVLLDHRYLHNDMLMIPK